MIRLGSAEIKAIFLVDAERCAPPACAAIHHAMPMLCCAGREEMTDHVQADNRKAGAGAAGSDRKEPKQSAAKSSAKAASSATLVSPPVAPAPPEPTSLEPRTRICVVDDSSSDDEKENWGSGGPSSGAPSPVEAAAVAGAVALQRACYPERDQAPALIPALEP